MFSLFLFGKFLSITAVYSILTEVPCDHQTLIHQSPYRVLGIGSSMVDLIIHVDEDFLLNVPGEKGGSQILSFNDLQNIVKNSEKNPKITTGGSSANTIKGLANLGVPCAFLSFIGTDSYGDFFHSTFKQLKIVPLFTKSILPTSQVLCLITPDGQRTMRSFQGSSQEMSERFLHPDYFKNIELLLIDGYTVRNEKLTLTAMQLAKSMGAKISFDLSSFELVRQYKDFMMHLLNDYVDIVFANEDEILALTGLSPVDGCKELQKKCDVAVVLMGNQGCLVGHQGSVTHYPTIPTSVVDSTGAGDLFASGFIFNYLENKSLDECANLGNLLGMEIIQVEGGSDLPECKWNQLKAEKL